MCLLLVRSSHLGIGDIEAALVAYVARCFNELHLLQSGATGGERDPLHKYNSYEDLYKSLCDIFEASSDLSISVSSFELPSIASSIDSIHQNQTATCDENLSQVNWLLCRKFYSILKIC